MTWELKQLIFDIRTLSYCVRLRCTQKSSHHTPQIACPLGVPCVLFCNRMTRLFTMGFSQLFLTHIWGCGPQTNISYSSVFSQPPEYVSSWLWVKVCVFCLFFRISLRHFLSGKPPHTITRPGPPSPMLFVYLFFSGYHSHKRVPVPGVSYMMRCWLLIVAFTVCLLGSYAAGSAWYHCNLGMVHAVHSVVSSELAYVLR